MYMVVLAIAFLLGRLSTVGNDRFKFENVNTHRDAHPISPGHPVIVRVDFLDARHNLTLDEQEYLYGRALMFTFGENGTLLYDTQEQTGVAFSKISDLSPNGLVEDATIVAFKYVAGKKEGEALLRYEIKLPFGVLLTDVDPKLVTPVHYSGGSPS